MASMRHVRTACWHCLALRSSGSGSSAVESDPGTTPLRPVGEDEDEDKDGRSGETERVMTGEDYVEQSAIVTTPPSIIEAHIHRCT